jgi:hypothetical protein
VTLTITLALMYVACAYVIARQALRIGRLNTKLREQHEAAIAQTMLHADVEASWRSELSLADAEVRRLADELERRQLGNAS